MDEKKIETTRRIWEELNRDYVSYEQANEMFSQLKASVTDVKRSLEATLVQGSSDTKAKLEQFRREIASFQTRLTDLIASSNQKTASFAETRLLQEVKRIEKLIPTIPEPELFDPTELQNQIDVLMAYEVPPLLPETVRDLLETLKDEDRLDASAIKNLPEAVVNNHRVIASATALWHLMDVDVAGISVGQSIKWDGVRWIPFTPAGGTSTPVYNEVAGGSGTAFTLAHTPTSSDIVRVYARGQRILSPGGYSISGANITTVDSWSAGDITVDYEY